MHACMHACACLMAVGTWETFGMSSLPGWAAHFRAWLYTQMLRQGRTSVLHLPIALASLTSWAVSHLQMHHRQVQGPDNITVSYMAVDQSLWLQ